MNLAKKDISDWRQAWRAATHPDRPNRIRLYEVYTDINCDPHLSGCVDQRKNMVVQKAFRLTDRNKKENPAITEIFEAEWFKDFIKIALDSRYWGHSLIQLGDVVSTGGVKRFAGVEIVPRAHVVPEFGVITRDQGGDPVQGVSYREGKLALWCVEVGMSKDLGLYLKCSPPALSKKNMLAFWDGFGELFGMPIRIAKTISRDPSEIAKVESMLSSMGAAAWGLFPEGTEIEVKESSRGDAFNVYDQRINRANSEMSKCILNQTMTVDDGASLSQSQVHLKIFENVVSADADMVKDVVNNKLLPLMIQHGFPVEGYQFEWDEAVEYTPDQRRSVEQMLLSAGYEIPPEYFIEQYNIPITGRSAPSALPAQMSYADFFGGKYPADFFV
jgi:phage gp29-like protein